MTPEGIGMLSSSSLSLASKIWLLAAKLPPKTQSRSAETPIRAKYSQPRPADASGSSCVQRMPTAKTRQPKA